MSSTHRSQKWLCAAAFAAGFWITLRVVAAPVPPAAIPSDSPATAGAPGGSEIADPALELLIAQFAAPVSARR